MSDRDPDPAEDAGMTDEMTVVFVSGFYNDLAGAKDDYQAVQDLYYEINALEEFDAVVIGKQDSGDVKILKKPEQPIRYSRLSSGGWGLASGLAMALYPAAAIGTGLLVGSPEAFTGLVGFGAEVVGALGRSRLLTLGERLDAAESGLIVAAAPERESAVRKVIGRTEAVESNHTTLDLTHLERTMRDARREVVA